jgi:hypothetical protein
MSNHRTNPRVVVTIVLNATIAIRPIRLHELGHLSLAGCAPGRPEVDDDDLALELGKLTLGSHEVAKRDFLSAANNRRISSRALALEHEAVRFHYRSEDLHTCSKRLKPSKQLGLHHRATLPGAIEWPGVPSPAFSA